MLELFLDSFSCCARALQCFFFLQHVSLFAPWNCDDVDVDALHCANSFFCCLWRANDAKFEFHAPNNANLRWLISGGEGDFFLKMMVNVVFFVFYNFIFATQPTSSREAKVGDFSVGN